ncbi:MAG TPA: FMN-binding protein [Sedimentisphaerales bacterium]|nr:FMN-binding protein [Sedimentisphaerales bacterium]
MSNIKHFFEQSWLLIVSSFFFGLLIAVANAAWSERIVQNEIDKRNRLMTDLIADANSFDVAAQAVEIPDTKAKVVKTDIYRALDGSGRTVGFAFIAVGSGFQDKIKLVIAVDGKCEKFLGFKVLASNETPGFGDKIKDSYFSSQFRDAPAGKLQLVKTGDDKKIDSEIVAISGATVSSEAVVKIFNTYIDTVREHLQTKGSAGNGK